MNKSPLPPTLLHCLLESKNRPAHHKATIFKSDQSWLQWNWQDLFREVQSLAGFLALEGLKAGDPVAILSSTRVEWLIADLAIMGLGGISVPIYTSSRSEEIKHICNRAGIRFLICEKEDLILKVENLADQCPSLTGGMNLNEETHSHLKWPNWRQAIISGRRYCQEHPDFFEQSIQKLQPSDLATIVYTSGTTGQPKGATLTHMQIMSEIVDVFHLLKIDHRDTSLSFLPYAHILGRVECWGAVYSGFTLGFAESMEMLSHNLQQIKPTVLIGVPRIFEKIFNSICTQIEAHPLRHRFFQWSLKASERASSHYQQKSSPSIAEWLQLMAVKPLLFNPVIKKFGGRLRFAISGGAPLNPELVRFFHAAGLLILEGYGLTETTAAITLNTPLNYELGTVGKPIGDVKIKLDKDGEICVKSEKVMKGYYGDLPKTSDYMTPDGYFKTGDIGEFTKSGFLKITDRKKDLIKTAGGKYISPQRLENLIKESKYISQILIHGDRRKYIVALVTLNQETIKDFLEEHKISLRDDQLPSQLPQVIELIRETIAEANSQLASFETIKNFAVLPQEFTVANGELTANLKVRRHFCDQKYKEILDRLYGNETDIL